MTPNFDRIARHYRWLERLSFGGLLQDCRVAMIPRLGGASRALVVGDGDGRFLAELVRAWPALEVDALDLSPGMTRLARRRAPGVRFETGDVRTHPLPVAGYDLIVTNFLLDCFGPADLRAVVGRLTGAATPDARWVVGDFALPAVGWRRTLARSLLAAMYGFFRLSTGLRTRTLADPEPILAACGWKAEAERSWLGGFLVSRLWHV